MTENFKKTQITLKGGRPGMVINLGNGHELVVTVHSDSSCRVDFREDGRLLGSEEWASVSDVIEIYC